MEMEEITTAHFSHDLDDKTEKRVKEMQEQVGTLSVLTTITLLLALLMVVLYILEMICSVRANGGTTSSQLPTAVVIQPKEEKKEKEKSKRESKDGCRHNSNRHLPSKVKQLELDVKGYGKEKAGKDLPKGEMEKIRPMPLSLEAPPPYTEVKKDAALKGGITSLSAVSANLPKLPKSETTSSTSAQSAATLLPTSSSALNQQPALPKSAISSAQPSGNAAPYPTVPAVPPTFPTNLSNQTSYQPNSSSSSAPTALRPTSGTAMGKDFRR
ncbi:hypothetical protein V3C99_012076 [Haemonchus contortus]|uniref:Uncharacterized protein n=1 Tax=Haemonchus contortus TaxID=6289 RepID=A0A7I4Y3A6_HAECO|nr:unnamed protein product [Haemonchus contortus]